MAGIQSDEFGLWTIAGGWIARPVFATQFKAGDQVKTHHFGGSIRAGVGKDDSCIRGHYLEYWSTTGTMFNDPEPFEPCESLGIKTLSDRIDWYKQKFVEKYPIPNKKKQK